MKNLAYSSLRLKNTAYKKHVIHMSEALSQGIWITYKPESICLREDM